MDYNTLIEAATPLVLAVIALVIQELKRRDTNAHGDAFIAMLKGAEDTIDKVASIFPQVAPIVQDYKEVVDEADKLWNSGGLTAADIKTLEAKAAIYKQQIDEVIANLRKLKTPTV
jgi:hypothetical protein